MRRRRGTHRMGVGITAAAAVLMFLLLRFAAGARAELDLCDSLFVPPGYALLCERGDNPRAVVRPADGSLADLSRLSLRELAPEGPDRLAWRDPVAWLQRQMEFDLSGIADMLERAAKDPANPLDREQFEELVAGLAKMLRKLGKVALLGCEDAVRTRLGHHVLRCRFGVDPLELHVQVRLVEAGRRRFAINIWALDRRRLRHFEAIANGFQPAA